MSGDDYVRGMGGGWDRAHHTIAVELGIDTQTTDASGLTRQHTPDEIRSAIVEKLRHLREIVDTHNELTSLAEPEKSELKPCPWCAGEASVEHEGLSYICICFYCNATAGPSGLSSTRAGAIEAWNKRGGGGEHG